MRIFLYGLYQRCMNPALMVFANRSEAFSLYDFNLAGVSAKQLAAVCEIPVHRVEEQIEAVRLCLKYQVKVSLKPAVEMKTVAA